MNKTPHKIYISSFFIVGEVVTILLAINGYEYYSNPLEERFFTAHHARQDQQERQHSQQGLRASLPCGR